MGPGVDVLGIGECSVDDVARVEALPSPGGKARILSRERLAGGQIATALLGCARLGRSTKLVSSVGDDAGAELALAPLRAAGVDVSRVQRVAGAATRCARIFVEDRTGERIVLWERAAALALAPGDLSRSDVTDARLLLTDATDLALSLHAARLARAEGRPCVLDADTTQPEIRRLLEVVSHPVISEGLARSLFGSADLAVRELARAGAALPAVTLGRGGAVAWIAGAPRWTPAFAIDAVDTTGAGDAFHAGLAHGLLLGAGGAELLRIAHGVAAIACGARGAQGGLPDLASLSAFLAAPPPPAPRESERGAAGRGAFTPLPAR